MSKRSTGKWPGALLTLLLIAATPVSAAADGDIAPGDEANFDPQTGYRIAHYRAPVPPSVPGGTRISAADVDALRRDQNAALIDVMASYGAGPDPQTGAWRLSKPRTNIPGSIWLPDVGKGKIEPTLEAYFRQNLQLVTGGDKRRAVIIYCQADCWMSWNAVRRAAGYGYSNLYWLSEGTDGWSDWDGTLVPATPVKLSVGSPSGGHF